MSAAGSIIGQCEECCECLAPTVEWDSRSASLTKSGFRYSTALTDYYLEQDLSAVFTFVEAGPGARFTRETYSGGPNTYDPVTASVTVNMTQRREQGPLSSACDDSVIVSDITSPASFSLTVANPFQPAGVASWCFGDGPKDIILSEPFTTALLKSYTVSALPAYDDDWNDTAGSFANLSTDELTYTIRESRYRFRFKIPKVGFGLCYKLTWVERFTPEGGGAVTDTPRCTIWDGSTPGGYNPEDDATWPVLPSDSPFYFELPVPSSDGTTTVEDVVAECLRCEACP